MVVFCEVTPFILVGEPTLWNSGLWHQAVVVACRYFEERNLPDYGTSPLKNNKIYFDGGEILTSL